MVVRANDLAFGHLIEDRLPCSIEQALADRELLIAEVVEFENHRVGLAAIHAVRTEAACVSRN